MKRVLVAQHRLPEHDRERGSLRVQHVVEALRSDGWRVTFVALDDEGPSHYARELRRQGIEVIVGQGPALDLVLDEGFELAVIAFWHTAERLVPLVRERCPDAAIVIDSIDLHFLREGRRRLAQASDGSELDAAYGTEVARELASYAAADAVLCVSSKEAELLDDVVGRSLAMTVRLGESVPEGPDDPTDRRGVLFVGNFRHLPNIEAVDWFVDDVWPLVPETLRNRHPLRIVGHQADERLLAAISGVPQARLVGWVPEIAPELHRARASVVPLLHGAGVKGKLLQSLMAATPTVSTSIGVEGVDITSGHHVLVADRPDHFAEALTVLLADDDRWRSLSKAGRRFALDQHGVLDAAAEFIAVIDAVMGRTPPADDRQDLATVAGEGHAASRSDTVAEPRPVGPDSTSGPIGSGIGPAIAVAIATHRRPGLLDGALRSLEAQTLSGDLFEVVVVDDGSGDETPAVLAAWEARLPLQWRTIEHAGRSVAKDLAVSMASAPLVLLFDDDDVAAPDLLEVHVAAHRHHPDPTVAVLGHTDWDPCLTLTPVMHHVTEVGRSLFSYPSLEAHRPLDWRHFWEGRVSAKRELLVESGGHDPSLEYSIDIELAYRLAHGPGLSVVYEPAARSAMARPVTLHDMCRRARAKGRAHWQIAAKHRSAELASYCGVDAAGTWPEVAAGLSELHRRIIELESVVESEWRSPGHEIHRLFGQVIDAHHSAGLWEASRQSRERPVLSVVIPVWSVTSPLADMAEAAIDRVRRAASVPTEIIVVENGSPVRRAHVADVVVDNDTNLGVAVAWNQGIAAARGQVVAVLNSDCAVESGWDRALVHAAIDGRRIAFPYTDHIDEQGPRQPDQGGTAGWCFAARPEVFAELGTFDETFSPAFFEDTDYWHRAWIAGVDLSPVPAAVVAHRRRTTAGHLDDAEALLVAHRRRYEEKWGLGFDAVPPFWKREIVEYPIPGRIRLARRRPDTRTGSLRPRVFGVGLTKTGTSSLHAALAHLGFRSVHHGDEQFRAAMEAAVGGGRPPLDGLGDELDAFCDVPVVVGDYAVFDHWYPGSLFVLTLRDLDVWLESRVRHVERNRHLAALGRPHGTALEIELDRWRAEWERHHDDVRRHFAGRPVDLLELDICGGEGWERLAPFVGWERIPERTFPWEHRGADIEPSPVTDVDGPRAPWEPAHVAAS